MLSCYRVVSRFLSTESKRAYCLRFIFWQYFVPSPPPLKPKLKHWIRTTAIGYPPQTVRLSPSTATKRSSQPWSVFSSLNCVSILHPPNQSTTPSELHSCAIVTFHHCITLIVPPHNNTHSDELADHLSLPEQLINMWIHVNKYFKITQYHVGL
jgi:hypothetical protein